MTPDDLAIHADFLRRLASRLLESPDLAEDAVQETLVLAWRKQPEVESPRGWLSHVLRNVVRNQRRGDRRRQAHHGRAPAQASSHTPEAILEREETRKRLLDAVLGLPEAERDVVLLRYGDGLPPRKVAIELGLPTHTVHNRLRSGLARLRRGLDEAYGGDGRRLRGALLLFTPSLPSKFAGAGLGGVLVGKKLIVLGALLLLGLAAFFVFDGRLAGDGERSLEQAARLFDGAGREDELGPELEGGAVRPAVPVEAQVPKNARLFGRILDQTSQTPVAGARVTSFDYERLVSVTTTTDEMGQFEFAETNDRSGAFHLVVTHPDHAPNVLRAVRTSAAGLTLQRRAGGWITGRLAEPNGEPVPRFRVFAVRRLFDPLDDYDVDVVASQVVLPSDMTIERSAEVDDEGGAFRLGPLQPGVHVLVFEVEGHVPLFEAQGANYYDRTRGITVQANEDTDVDAITLPSEGRLVLRIVDADSEMVVEDVRFEAEIAVNGRRYRTLLPVTERGPEGAYLVPVAVSQKDLIRSTMLLVSKPGYSVHSMGIAGQQNGTLITMRLNRTARLNATILRPDGRPAVRATAIVRRDSNHVLLDQQATDASGFFTSKDLPPGVPLELVVLDATTLEVMGVFPFQLEPGDVRTLTLGGPDQTALEGVCLHDGQPIRRALVSLDTPTGRMVQVQTHADGGFRFDGLVAGVHEIAIAMDVPQVYLARKVTLEEGKVFRLDVDLAYRLHGTTDWTNPEEGDEGLGNPTLMARPVDGQGFTVSHSIANDGSFVLMVPRAARYEIVSEFSDHVLLGTTQALASKDGAPLHLRLYKDPRDGRAVFQVVDAKTGAALPDVGFSYQFREISGGGSAVDGVVTDGTLHLGTHRYIFRSPAHVAETRTIEITEDVKHVERQVKMVASNSIEVIGFTPTSRAKQAGLALGDVVLAYGEHPVRKVGDLVGAIRDTATTDAVTVEIRRAGERKLIEVPGGRMGVRVVNRRLDE